MPIVLIVLIGVYYTRPMQPFLLMKLLAASCEVSELDFKNC